MALTEKQKRFADEYLTDLNATQAAIRAGYSEKTARSIGQRLLTKVDIQKYIQERLKERQERAEITQEMIVNELCKLGFAEVDTELLKPSDKIKALELTARMLGLDRPMDSGEAEDLSEAEGDIFG